MYIYRVLFKIQKVFLLVFGIYLTIFALNVVFCIKDLLMCYFTYFLYFCLSIIPSFCLFNCLSLRLSLFLSFFNSFALMDTLSLLK